MDQARLHVFFTKAAGPKVDGAQRHSQSQLVLAMKLDAFQRQLLSRLRLQKTVVEKKNKTQEQYQSKANVVEESQPIACQCLILQEML